MTELLGGLLMLGGGSTMVVSSVLYLTRSGGPNAAELARSLPFTPLPPPDAALEQLVASID